jgi:hypothetical protein
MVSDHGMMRDMVLRSRRVRAEHDPTRRFLAATAEVYEPTLVTEDERLCGARASAPSQIVERMVTSGRGRQRYDGVKRGRVTWTNGPG